MDTARKGDKILTTWPSSMVDRIFKEVWFYKVGKFCRRLYTEWGGGGGWGASSMSIVRLVQKLICIEMAKIANSHPKNTLGHPVGVKFVWFLFWGHALNSVSTLVFPPLSFLSFLFFSFPLIGLLPCWLTFQESGNVNSNINNIKILLHEFEVWNNRSKSPKSACMKRSIFFLKFVTIRNALENACYTRKLAKT